MKDALECGAIDGKTERIDEEKHGASRIPVEELVNDILQPSIEQLIGLDVRSGEGLS